MRMKKKSARRRVAPRRLLRFEFTCPSDPKKIGGIEQFLQRMNRRMRFDDGTMYRLLVATTEAVNNAMIHGNKLDPSKLVVVTILVSERLMRIRVKDEGMGFDPATIPNPLDENNLLKESGRGVFLARSLMDDVQFVRLKHGWVVELRVNLRRT